MKESVDVQRREEGIAVITLNRPHAANALSKRLLGDLREAICQIRHDSSVRAVLITGAGEKAFCAGADLKERKTMTAAEVKQTVQLIGKTIHEVEALPQPVIAAVNGAAFGGGLELALACDIRIVSKRAKMGLTETSLAIIPGAGGTQRLPRLIGVGKAKELIFTAKKLSAEEAEQIGLAEYAVEPEALREFALNLAKQIVKNAPLALMQAKTAINQGMQVSLTAGLEIERLAYQSLIATEDRLEGLRAFAEKRPPQYQGK
ncbi:enoyl-CoA hydratase [Bacillus xiapuensis]|uniref:enoyl-CoA hydratase n=1 Tax=Bacillus xiapuensis TaxID=2014075 RepID=UPI000C24FBF2|nr:enoyl-CoA hydratase [Bacillus xiapuensis]